MVGARRCRGDRLPVRPVVAVITLLAACTTSHGARKTDLERVHEFWKSLVPTSARDTMKVGCVCQGGALGGRIGTLVFTPFTGVGGTAVCYALDFDMQGELTGGTPCDGTYVIMRK